MKTKINVGAYDLTELAQVGLLGGKVGEAFGREVILPILERVPIEHRLGFFISIFSYPVGLLGGCLDAQTTAEFFARLEYIEASVRAQLLPYLGEARH